MGFDGGAFGYYFGIEEEGFCRIDGGFWLFWGFVDGLDGLEMDFGAYGFDGFYLGTVLSFKAYFWIKFKANFS